MPAVFGCVTNGVHTIGEGRQPIAYTMRTEGEGVQKGQKSAYAIKVCSLTLVKSEDAGFRFARGFRVCDRYDALLPAST